MLSSFTVLTVALTYPLSLHLGSVSLGSDPDVHTFTWTLGWNAHAFLHRPWAIFEANIFFPYTRTLAFSENLIGSAFIAAPVVWLTGNYVLAMNVVAMLSVVLCGAGAYLLARQLGLGTAAGLVCGIIFAFSPARFFRFQQIHLTAIQWIPFALAFLHAYLGNGRLRAYLGNGRSRDLKLAVAFFVLQALTSLHGAVFLALAVAALLTQRALVRTGVARVRWLHDMGMVGAAMLGVLALVAVPYLTVQREMGLVRTLENWVPAPESCVANAGACLVARAALRPDVQRTRQRVPLPRLPADPSRADRVRLASRSGAPPRGGALWCHHSPGDCASGGAAG